jgi:biotin/methionine sulfoxide reductase
MKLTTANHWGSYVAELRQGQVDSLSPLVLGDDVSDMSASILDTLDGKSRIRRPAIRESWLKGGPGTDGHLRGADRFIEVEWDQALDLLAGEITRIRGTHGNQAIYAGSYGWASAGRFHHAQSQIHRFYNMAGGYTKSVNAYSFAAGEVILPHILTDLRSTMYDAPSWYEIAEHTDLMLAFGGLALKNTQIQNGGLGQHTARDWMAKLGAGKGQFIGISPIRDDMTPELQAEWMPIRPNTDTALMMALAYCLDQAGKVDTAFLARYTTGFDAFRPYLLGESDGVPKTPAWAAQITGIPETDITALADRMTRGRVLISLSWSLQRADHGEQSYWMGVVLAAMLGQIGLPGGGIAIGLAGEHGNGNPDPQLRWAAVPTGRNPIDSFIPVARISDMLLNPGAEFDYNGKRLTYPDIRMVHWAGGNPFHHHQDLNRLRKAWAKPETVVVQEIFWTPAARHADIVLPVTTVMERNDIAVAQLDGWAVAMKKLVAPVGQARNDHDIMADVADRLGFKAQFTEDRSEMDWLRDIWDRSRQEAGRVGRELPSFDDFWEAGHLHLEGGPETRCFLGEFRKDPIANRLKTPTGKIEIFSKTIADFGYAEIAGHPTWTEPYEWLGGAAIEQTPLHLISNQPKSRLHSQLDPGRGSVKTKIQGREPMRMNPQDAKARGLQDGALVRVFNARGSCLAGIFLDEAIMPGVVQLATGAWYDPEAPERDGSLDRHGNPNVLTADRGTSRLSQGPSAHTCLVQVEAVLGDTPEMKAFDQPAFASG